MPDQTNSADPANLRPFIGAFSIWYVCALLALTGISFATGVGFGYIGNIAILVAAAVMTGVRFADDMGRDFEGREKWKLALFCLLASFVWSFLNTMVVTFLFTAEEGRQNFLAAVANMPVTAWVFSLAIVSFFYYFALVLFLGVGVKNSLRKQGRTE